MPTTSAFNGTITSDATDQTIGGELTAAGTYVLYLDVSPLADDDEIEIARWRQQNSTDGYREIGERVPLRHDLGDRWIESPPMVLTAIDANEKGKFTVKRVAGTDRTYRHNVAKIA
jgi:hypothetical protein